MTELELRVRGGDGRDDHDRGRSRHDRNRAQNVGNHIDLNVGESVDIVAMGLDQSGNRFPGNRIYIGVEIEDRCNGITIDNRRADGFRLVAGKRRESCEVTVWVPGNMNLDRTIRVEVGGHDDRGDRRSWKDRLEDRKGWNRVEADRIANRLYNSILFRDPDAIGLKDTIDQILAGRLDARIEQMVGSPEFRRRRSSPQGFLDEYYHGLLHRDPDAAGARTYLDDIQRGRHTQVVLAIVRSEEFENGVRDK